MVNFGQIGDRLRDGVNKFRDELDRLATVDNAIGERGQEIVGGYVDEVQSDVSDAQDSYGVIGSGLAIGDHALTGGLVGDATDRLVGGNQSDVPQRPDPQQEERTDFIRNVVLAGLTALLVGGITVVLD